MTPRTGIVTKVFEKEWNGKSGPVMLYSFKLENDDMWYRTGNSRPNIAEGQHVKFVTSGQDVDVNSIEVSESEVATATPAASVASRATTSKDGYWAAREERDRKVTQPLIAYQAARRDAVAIVTSALENDVLAFGNTNKGKKLDMLVDFVEEVQTRLLVAYREELDELEQS